MTTDSSMATGGRLVMDRAAAGGPIIRLKISKAPTTGTVIAVASATTTRKHISMRWLRMPLASPISGTTEESISGRYSTVIATMQTTPRAATGTTSVVLTPSTSPNTLE